MSILLFGLAGRAQAGKDTFASVLVQKHYFHRVAFADPVKVAGAAMFGVPLQNFYNELKETDDAFWGISYRKMAQLVGTEMARNGYRQDIWIKRAEKEIENIKQAHNDTSNSLLDLVSDPSPRIVITDVRFENEATFVREMGGRMIHIVRNNQVIISETNHASENGVEQKNGDIVFVNGGVDMEGYTSSVDKWARAILSESKEEVGC